MPFENVDRTYLEDHVVISQSTEGGTKVITLNGVKGFIQHDILKAIGLMPTEPVKIKNFKDHKSLFDAFSKIDFSHDYPSIKILHYGSDILIHGMPIQTIVIESPVRIKEIAELISTRTEMEKKVEESLPESLFDEIRNFTRDYVKTLPKDEDSSIDQIQGLFDRVRREIESQIKSNGELTEANENDINGKMNIVEKYVCTALYDNIFSPKWSSDNNADEALCSKIASLNLLELGLSNLGVDIKPQQQERIDLAVQAAGVELQNLEQKKAPHEKLDSLVQCHRILVEALGKKTRRSPPNSDSANDTTENSYVASPPDDVSPASIPLPPSPTSPKPSNIPITPISPNLPMSPTSPNSPTDGFSDPNADAIFPLLIFTVVKSNPKKLVSNLRFISRYRVRDLLQRGESSYCHTNIMAVVQFLEGEEHLESGLSNKVLSESINSNSSLEQRTRKVGQDIVFVADNSIKVITGVMDSSVKMFGRLIGYNENTYTETNSLEKNKENSALLNTNTDQSEQNFSKNNNVNDIKTSPGLPEVGAVKELAEINTTSNNFKHTETSSSNVIEETKSFTGRLLPFNVLPRFSSERSHIDEESKGKNANKFLNKIPPPNQKFLDCPIDEFRVNDVPELLAEYKRLANAIRDLGLFSS